MQTFVRASLALAFAAPLGAWADGSADIAALRQELAALQASYEARLQALEQRLKAAEAVAAPAAAALPAVPAPVPEAATPPGTTGGANAFNPALSLILSGLYARTSQDPARYAIAGMPLPAGSGIGPGTRGFSLAESELGLAASIDPWLRGSANISLHPDNTVSVEEAYIQTTGLGAGLGLKAGRFFSAVGYLNAQHSHTWDFVDSPLAYQALLGTQYGDDGVQLGWLAPSDQFVELVLELGRGRSYPGGDNSRNGPGMAALALHGGGDLGDSNSWRAGVSVLNARADGLELQGSDALGNPASATFAGSTRVWVLDGIWKWAPDGNATRTSFKLQGEWLHSTRQGSLSQGGADSSGRSVQAGGYLQGIYQFLPGWRLGLRTERLQPVAGDRSLYASVFAGAEGRPRKDSLMLDFNASEFSRVRLQLARDGAREGGTDHQIFVQYQMSLGAHGAHSY
jgi:hypothetical protein